MHRDSHFVFDRRTWPVPWRFIGCRVWVRATPRSIEVYVDDARIITHGRGAEVPDAVLDRCLPDHRGQLRHRDRDFWEQRADAIAPQVGRYIRAVLDSDDVLSLLRTAQAMVLLLEKHPVERAIAACRRAEFYASHDYRSLRDILRKGLDLQPLPTAVWPAHGRLENPRYARSTAELMQLGPGRGHRHDRRVRQSVSGRDARLRGEHIVVLLIDSPDTRFFP